MPNSKVWNGSPGSTSSEARAILSKEGYNLSDMLNSKGNLEIPKKLSLHCDHVIPNSHFFEATLQSNDNKLSKEDIINLLKMNSTILVTSAENKRINSPIVNGKKLKHKDKMPCNWTMQDHPLARVIAAEIEGVEFNDWYRLNISIR